MDRGIIATLVIGLVVGAIAKLLMPGKDPGGCIITILLGIAGAFVGFHIGLLLALSGGLVMSVIAAAVGAAVVLFVWRMAK